MPLSLHWQKHGSQGPSASYGPLSGIGVHVPNWLHALGSVEVGIGLGSVEVGKGLVGLLFSTYILKGIVVYAFRFYSFIYLPKQQNL